MNSSSKAGAMLNNNNSRIIRTDDIEVYSHKAGSDVAADAKNFYAPISEYSNQRPHTSHNGGRKLS